MKKSILSALAMVIGLSFAHSQFTPPCATGVTAEDRTMIMERLAANKEALRANPVQNREIEYVPITFHMVANSAGNGRATRANVFKELCYINAYYTDLNLQFYVKEFNDLNNTTLYENHTMANFFMESQRDDNALNLYVIKDANTGSGLGTTLGYYSPNNDWMVMRISEMGKDGTTLAHELGHFFSLPHPFNGWDFEPYDPAQHGTPAPATSPGGVPTEKADGSNCETAGDMICDTPASYNQGFGWPNCNYTGGHLDPMGDPIDPEETNMMDYFLECDKSLYHFSNDQQAIIIQDYNSSSRWYIRHDYVPTYGELEISEQNYPVGGETTSAYNAINFEWEPIDGAHAYVLEIAKNAVFSVDAREFVVYGNTKVIEDFTPNALYYWRITPVTEAGACLSSTPGIETFRAGTAVASNDLDFVNNWNITPNPAVEGSDLLIDIDIQKSVEATISLHDLTGRVIATQNQSITQGANQLTFSLDNASAGVHILKITTTEGSLTKRIIVTK